MRKINCLKGLLVLVLMLTVYGVQGQEPMSDESDNGIHRLQWMVGHWEGEAFGGVCEEIWSPASGGTMLGTFKLLVEGKVQFTEFMSILPDSTGPRLLVKHFNPDMTGWEEKDKAVEFPFNSMSETNVEFDGISYERIAGDSLRITVTLSHGEGEPQVEVINCRLR